MRGVPIRPRLLRYDESDSFVVASSGVSEPSASPQLTLVCERAGNLIRRYRWTERIDQAGIDLRS